MANQEHELSFELPPGMELSSRAEPVEPKDAATVVLLRDSPAGPEVFLQHRVAGMAFAGGMTVFPGGGVDARDAEVGPEAISWAGPEPASWASWFGCAEPLARALVCAAVRETFEESGVLLAADESGVVGDTSVYAEQRAALESRELSLAGFLDDAGLTLRADLLRPWANWITPVGEPRRYDARFFVAALPSGQAADGATTEAERSGWQRPADALADAKTGHTMLMAPTWVTMTEFAEFDAVEDALAEHRTISPITPSLARDGKRVKVVLK